jgi:hypothetical protein
VPEWAQVPALQPEHPAQLPEQQEDPEQQEEFLR